jgi:hypothetical protein
MIRMFEGQFLWINSCAIFALQYCQRPQSHILSNWHNVTEIMYRWDSSFITGLGVGLWCLKPLLTIFQLCLRTIWVIICATYLFIRWVCYGWWLYGSWIYNYICNQCLSPLTLWVRILLMARCTWYNGMWWSLSVIFSWYSSFLPDITEILLKVALNTITLRSLKQQSMDRHVAPLGHIIPIPSQPVFALCPNTACLAEKQQIPILWSLFWPDWG